MAQKFSIIFSVMAFLVAWLSGLSASVPPDTILLRSVIGAAAFYLLGLAVCYAANSLLELPDEVDETADAEGAGEAFEEQEGPQQERNGQTAAPNS